MKKEIEKVLKMEVAGGDVSLPSRIAPVNR
jgi:hypothetical protein